MDGAIAVFITTGSLAQARLLAEALLDERLAACVSILPRVESRYRWHGKKECARETLLIAKSRAARLDAIITRVRQIHSDEVPEVIALPVAGGNPAYLAWLEEETA
jgi:periplasmic divalent cation tolerance protein